MGQQCRHFLERSSSEALVFSINKISENIVRIKSTSCFDFSVSLSRSNLYIHSIYQHFFQLIW